MIRKLAEPGGGFRAQCELYTRCIRGRFDELRQEKKNLTHGWNSLEL